MKLSRFVIDSKKFSAQKKTIKPRGLLPIWDQASGEYVLSTFQIDGLNELEIWELGAQNIYDSKGRTPRARGDLNDWHYSDAGCEVLPDNDPPRHVSIKGWSTEKPERMSMAQELSAIIAQHGEFHLSSSS